ncbi:probable mitochondrial adenine nucleotide transporter BTL1 isoform X2 [Rhodamnia argentea]|uniref:Probable mitochondrial adenine nucleotide transporter BTL1 isoform X2 n=1 Tax=Rhodamnia argentea TaxID=178133 RepID=A0A8B8QY42_9MYRT|nr:probable mitochondrial adenine nucleotide transporter BTL1 isoform X2 [Rhodamnia argentea]
MSPRSPSQSQKKTCGGVNAGFGDVYGVLILSKEMIDLDKDPPPFELRFQVPDFKPVLKDFFRTREVGEFLSGALAGAMTKAILAPLETIRTRMIVGVGSKNIAGSFLEVMEQQGWQGLWAGNTINMLRIVPTQAIELGTFECVKRAMTSAQEQWKQNEGPKVQLGSLNLRFSLSWISPVAVAGAAAGIASTLVCHPLEVLKDRLTISRDIYPSLRVALSKIYQDGGLGAFYAGISPTLIGFTASTISFPLEVARKRLMVGALQGKCPPHMAGALAEVIREEGLIGLYRGWGASCLKVMPSSGITWMFYEAWKDILVVGRHPI